MIRNQLDYNLYRHIEKRESQLQIISNKIPVNVFVYNYIFRYIMHDNYLINKFTFDSISCLREGKH